MARLALLAVLLVITCALAQTTYVLDSFTVAQPTISLQAAGTISNVACTSGGQSTSTLAGGVRKLQITAPSGTNVGQSVQLGVFIPTGQSSAPNGVQSGNNNLQSTTFQVLYRLDGDSASCSQTSSSTNALSKSVNNLNINLQTIGATAFVIQAQGDVTPNQVTVTLYSSSGSTLAVSNPINVVETGSNPMFDIYTLNFSDNTKWTSGSSFTGTVGAVELSWPEPANLQFAVNLVEFLVNPTTSVSAIVYQDCGCTGNPSASTSTPQQGVTVTLSISGSGCTASSQNAQTSSSGTVSFTGIPGGCTYTLATSGLTLCTNSAPSQSVASGGQARFGLLGTTGGLTIPSDKTINCGGDTSTASTGTASVAGGTCGGTGGTATFADTVTNPTCTAPGGTITVIKRAWTGAGSTQTQTITVVDTKSITFTNVPASTSVACGQTVPTTTATATSCTAVTVTSSDSSATGQCDTATCSSSSTITRTFTATDLCGNTASRTQTITKTGCAVSCPPPPPPSVPPPPTAAPPPPTNLPTNANCRFICDDDDSSAATLLASLAVLLVAFVAAF